MARDYPKTTIYTGNDCHKKMKADFIFEWSLDLCYLHFQLKKMQMLLKIDIDLDIILGTNSAI